MIIMSHKAYCFLRTLFDATVVRVLRILSIAIQDTARQRVTKHKANKVRREAIKAYDTMSMDDMRKCLRLFGVRSDNMSNQLIESTMFDIVDKKSDQYLTKWVNNKKKDTEFIIEEAVAKGVLRKERTQYYYGTEMIADSLSDAVAYLDNKKNQDLKLSIINEIKNK